MFIFRCSLTIVGIALRTTYQLEVSQDILDKSTASSVTISYTVISLGYLLGSIFKKSYY